MPILFSFFVMGFCDVVGISTTYVKNDFNLSEALAGFIPSMVFLWFLLLSVPVALAMNRVGRKRTVQISNVITIVGMLIPFVSYNFATCMVAFALLGIGNTILQVSLNPLLTNVVSGESLTSSLTAGQVVKAVSSFMGPIIAVFAVNVFGNWQYLFPIFAAITLLSSLWLMMTSIPKEEVSLQSGSSVGATFSLLKDSHILLFFIGILCTVGLDVGMNTLTPKLLIERCGLEITDAGLGSSVYFFCRTAGAFIGAFLLARLSDVRYLRVNLVVMLAALGVPKRVLIREDQSRDTMENCRNAAALLGGTGRVLVVTSDYHLRRAVMTARRAGLRADGLAAKTTGGRVGKRLMEACYIADLLLGWQDEGRARPAWTYRLFARVFGEQAKK